MNLKFRELLQIMNKHTFTNKINKAGFTLVELLLVVAIIGIVAGIGGDMFATVMRAYRRAELFSYTERVGNSVLTQIEQDLRAASLVTIPNGNTLNLSIPTASGGTVSKSYVFTPCSGANEGAVTLDGTSIFTSIGTNTFLATKLYVAPYSGNPIFSIQQDSTNRYSIVTVAFYVYSGASSGANSPCSSEPLRITKSLFTTSVNLRGGI